MSLNGVTEAEYVKHVNNYHSLSPEKSIISNATSTHTTSTNTSVIPLSHTSLKSNSNRGLNGSETPTEGSKWTVYSGSQNLPAVLNDPNRGKQVGHTNMKIQ